MKFWEKCPHKWIEKERHTLVVTHSPIHFPEITQKELIIVMKCENCGTLKNHMIG